MSKRRVFVVAGGDVDNSDFSLLHRERDWIIAADGGAVKCWQAGIVPHLAVGDFDTAGESFVAELARQGILIKRLPAAKAETDTQYAVREAIKKKPDEIIILGALGGSRFDHTLANVGLLEWMEQQGVRGCLYHRCNRIRLVTGPAEVLFVKENFSFVSLIPVTECVEGITTRGFLYPLNKESLYRGLTRGISNELSEEKATLTFERGKCLLVESRD
ncbi:thiamine diphosphokinase [Paenactinomyces guangxiensis]|uniref:Thiamine diphosphokinase n=1 Tax=Paenactinomyces guangxiensis TaxID=1490290 RepID=A0A7W1WRR6_9BACL|nr:thiamine diphosphokinase [Paenactinomyces guangxiensis]MBA4494758.1 thiamine diphosphokinase [Paenactinomyces guangxiensis]MBH8591842.1 thiamine diphosphokinase [Paenactinomyces guangxiensis]